MVEGAVADPIGARIGEYDIPVTLSLRRRGVSCLLGLVVSSGLLIACGNRAPSDGETGPDGSTSQPGSVSALPVGGGLDYQLGVAYDPPPGVTTVVRDRTAPPLKGGYTLCYVNAFQSQPGDGKRWDAGLLLEVDGKAVTDPDWPDETLLDTSTTAKRSRIVRTLAPWIAGCAKHGFDAVEFDNLDSYTRSHGALTRAHNVALARELTALAHDEGLAAAQKNIAEHAASLKKQVGFDLAVAEECAANRECDDYTRAYGDQVVDIEYTDHLPESFTSMCRQEGAPRLMILRDRDLLGPKEKGHVHRACP